MLGTNNQYKTLIIISNDILLVDGPYKTPLTFVLTSTYPLYEEREWKLKHYISLVTLSEKAQYYYECKAKLYDN